MTRSRSQNLVCTWLKGVGLDYAWQTFEAAGIVTPAALADLDVNYFEALGVTAAEDRRKLFYLVQRVKVGVKRGGEEKVVEEKKDSPDDDDEGLSRSCQPEGKALVLLDSDDDDDTDSADGDESLLENCSGVKSALNERPSSGKENKNEENASIPRVSSANSSIDDEVDEERETETLSGNSAQGDLSASFYENGENLQEEQLRRNSRRLVEKHGEQTTSSKNSIPETQSTKTENRLAARRKEVPSNRRSNLAEPASSRAETTVPRRAGTSSSMSFSRNKSNPALTKKRQNEKLVSKLRCSEQDDSSSDESSASSKSRRQSSLMIPKTRRSSSMYATRSKNLSKSMRTGKQLSTIPANSVAPMSPLIHLPASSNLEVSTGGDVRKERSASRSTTTTRIDRSNNRRRRSSSVDSFSDASCSNSGNISDSESTASSSYRWTDDDSRLDDNNNSKKSSSRRKSGVSSSLRDSKLRVSNRLKVGSQQREDDASVTSSRKITVHGGDQDNDNSFKSKIAKLREDNNADHELFSQCTESGNIDVSENMRIRVVIRKRPMSAQKGGPVTGDVDIIHPLDHGEYGKILAYQPKTRVDLTKEVETVPFAYDNVFGENATNRNIYERAVRNLIPPLLEEQGLQASIFCYGQTGSGKTYTMMGSNLTGINNGSASFDKSNLGLYYMAALDIFQAIRMPGFEDFIVGVSLFEIYANKLFDLLNGREQIKCLEDSKGQVRFPGLTEHSVSDPDQLIELIEIGAEQRSTGTTSRNADSSRSHAVLQLYLRKPSKTNRRTSTRTSAEHSRLTFIDLAGSERGADTSSSSRATRLEGAEINTSLLALKEVIRALARGDPSTHTPFRGSKLTQVLKESFVGEKCLSVMIACISPNIGNCEQTLNTLRYADRIKERNSETGELPFNNDDARGPSRRLSCVANNRRSRNSSILADGLSSGFSAPDLPKTASAESCSSFLLEDILETPRNTDTKDSFSNDDSHSRRDSSNSALLNEILASPIPERIGDGDETNNRNKNRLSNINMKMPQPQPTSCDTCEEAQQLILAHKAAMSALLDMVKDEMALVNKADSDREGLDDYISHLNDIQTKQSSILVKLSEQVTKFREATRGSCNESSDGVLSDGDSFEDLRD